MSTLIILLIVTNIVTALILAWVKWSTHTALDPRQINPIDYYQNHAPLQDGLTELWTLALCSNTTILYLEEVFTVNTAVTELAKKLNDDLKQNGISDKYWTIIKYETPHA